MTIIRAIATLVACTLLLAAVGGGIGYALGRFVPGYYRGVFRGGNHPLFDPVSVGVGQGLTQGAAGGVVAGLVVIAILSWRETRLRRPDDAVTGPADRDGGGRGGRGTTARVFIVAGGVLALAFCSGAGL